MRHPAVSLPTPPPRCLAPPDGARGEAEPRRPIESLPWALDDPGAFRAALGGRRPAVFLDYDGTLTPIVDRPQDAILSAEGRAAVAALAARLPVAVVSGRDRADVETLVGLPDLIYAGSHGFDIRVPGRGAVAHAGLTGHDALLDRAEARLRAGLDPLPGALVERKAFSIAAHYRLVAEADYPAFRAVLDDLLAGEPGLKEKPGKKVVELQPAIDWDKGKAVLHLREALDLAGPDIVPLFFGDDVTDEDAFAVLPAVGGVGLLVAGPEENGSGRTTTAAFRLPDPAAVYRLLATLAS